MSARFTAAILVLTASVALCAGPAFDSPEAAKKDADYPLQGEYAGEFRNNDTGETIKVGVQILSLGGGKFSGVSYVGGLPGDGWDGDTEKKHAMKEAQAVNGVLTFQDPENQWSAIVKEAQIHVYFGGNLVSSFNKVERRSETIGKKPPEGAVVLFSGKKEDLSQWQDGAKVTDDGLLQQGVTSKPAFGDHTLHIEFRLPYQPEDRGQNRGNSGVYLGGKYEVQMLDSFALSGEDNECGGVYKVGKPRVNMCYPPLAWQTYDVEYTAAKFDAGGTKTSNARMTVYHNGVKIHENLEVPAPTTASPVSDEKAPGPVYLQDHGNPVRYRNIWVLPK